MPPRKATATNLGANSDGFAAGWTRFWFAPTDRIVLDGVRVLTGALVAFWLLSFIGHGSAFFSQTGWVDREAVTEISRLPADSIPQPLTWSLVYVTSGAMTEVLYVAAIAIVLLFTFGVWTRITGVLTWVIVASFTANPMLAYGGDTLLLILTFYLMLGYLAIGWGGLFGGAGERPTLSALWGGPRARFLGAPARPSASVAANVAIRLIQVHLAILIFISGAHKLQSSVWWAGLALWFPLNPPFETTAAEVLDSTADPLWRMIPLSLACYGVLAWQISFPFVMWRPRWRKLMLTGAALGWLGCVFIFRQPTFGPAIFIGCLTFLPAESWRRWALTFGAVFRRGTLVEEAEPGAVGAGAVVAAEAAPSPSKVVA